MPNLPSYPSISDPNEFQEWVSCFRGKSGWVCPAKIAKSQACKHLISETLQAITAIPVKRGSNEVLELNLLYACYLAFHSPAPEQDFCAKARRDLMGEKESRRSALDSLKRLQDYLEAQRATALKAIAQTDAPDTRVTSRITTRTVERLDALTNLLADLEHGLLEFEADPDHIALISSADFRYGPFEFDFDINSTWMKKGTSQATEGINFIQSGLMFHLTYLFRYFTCDPLPKTAAFFKGDILILDGCRMIPVGKPHNNVVAALTNAVFETKYSSRDIKDRLDALYKPTPGSKINKNPTFVGW